MQRRTHTRTRTAAVLAAALLPLSLLPAVASASGPPEHGHAMLRDLVMSPNPDFDPTAAVTPDNYPLDIQYSHCVNLANARQLPLHVHHDTVHDGTAATNIAQRTRNSVVPLFPITPFRDCDDVARASRTD